MQYRRKESRVTLLHHRDHCILTSIIILTAELNMDTLPQEGDWRIVRLKTHQRHLRSFHQHPLIKILARVSSLMVKAQQVGGN
jgi:exoribonuclease II